MNVSCISPYVTEQVKRQYKKVTKHLSSHYIDAFFVVYSATFQDTAFGLREDKIEVEAGEKGEKKEIQRETN